MEEQKQDSEFQREIEKGIEMLNLFRNLSTEGKRAIMYYGQGLLAGGMERKTSTV